MTSRRGKVGVNQGEAQVKANDLRGGIVRPQPSMISHKHITMKYLPIILEGPIRTGFRSYATYDKLLDTYHAV
jgi:hypothetical protein